MYMGWGEGGWKGVLVGWDNTIPNIILKWRNKMEKLFYVFSFLYRAHSFYFSFSVYFFCVFFLLRESMKTESFYLLKNIFFIIYVPCTCVCIHFKTMYLNLSFFMHIQGVINHKKQTKTVFRKYFFCHFCCAEWGINFD